MKLVHHAVDGSGAARVVPVRADRLTLAKTRWRGRAADGAEFGFDLAHPLCNGDCVAVDGGVAYRIEQEPESLLIVMPDGGAPGWARAAWALGNLHQPVEVREDGLRVADDPAARAALTHLHLSFREARGVFTPPRAAAHHAHAHHGH